MLTGKKPIVFVGSSTEGLDIARALEELLREDASIEIWASGIFPPSAYPVDALLAKLDNCDYGVFVLSPDDVSVSHNKERPSPRDNVIFEAGLFMGRLGRLRTFLIYDKENDVKMPSDLAGLTLLPYSHKTYSENVKAAIGPAANQIRTALSKKNQLEELGFVKAFLRFIDPGVSLTDTYYRIVNRNLDQIRSEVSRLEANGDWTTMLQVKTRLREFFEYSGKYKIGAAWGRQFANAQKQLGEDLEAAWTNVKQVAYLEILAGEHKTGRQLLISTLDTLRSRQGGASESATLEFYCHRYLGISYQREELPGNLDEARRHFDEAQGCISAAAVQDPAKTELQARLLTNYGNLALAAGEIRKALEFYTASLKLFIKVKDSEHIGIANLKIGEAIIAGAGDLREAGSHLDYAEGLFLELGYIELQGRVAEQRARLGRQVAAQASDLDVRRTHIRVAIDNANRAKRLYRQIDSQKRLGAIEEILKQLGAEFPGQLAQMASVGQST